MPFRTEADLLTAVQSPEAEEADHLELKRELPPGDAGTREIGKDLAAMALGGGVILVGVRGDLHPSVVALIDERGRHVSFRPGEAG